MSLPVNFLILKPKDPLPTAEMADKKYVILKNDGISLLVYGPVDSETPLVRQIVVIPDDYKFEIPYVALGRWKIRAWWIPPCRNYCGHHLQRWHFTCFTKCKFRQILAGKHPQSWPVEVFMFYRTEQIGRGVWKNRVIKYLWGIMELFAVGNRKWLT